jgi:hypothetical protein
MFRTRIDAIDKTDELQIVASFTSLMNPIFAQMLSIFSRKQKTPPLYERWGSFYTSCLLSPSYYVKEKFEHS